MLVAQVEGKELRIAPCKDYVPGEANDRDDTDAEPGAKASQERSAPHEETRKVLPWRTEKRTRSGLWSVPRAKRPDRTG